MDSNPVACPCGCGAELPGMVAERERGLRAETLAAAPRHRWPAREHTRAYLLTGLPGAGKSTVARLLALHFDRAAHIDIDLVFHHFTVSGRAEPSTPSGQADQQAELAAANAGGMARNYSQQAPLDTVRMILAHGAAGRL